ncbi:MAG: sulfurtransferase [Pirellulaceae bacterium]|nr:sulfurtransferase [Pirellulaceae bacterium]
MTDIVNIAGYQFVSLDRLAERRDDLLRECRERSIKGTILLSSEGINLFLAGQRLDIDGFLECLRADDALKNFHVKQSLSDRQPFNRILVRLKKEIIAFGIEGINPQQRTSPKLKPRELKSWLDEGRPVTLLDVRNNYEVDLGTFENAVVADIDHFRQFPDAVRKMEKLNGEAPIVMFCTGGIRCEKAGPYMEQAGFDSIFQLDGGILQYFEDCGGEHYDGDCFVFDQRVAVDPQLQETDAEVCFACQAVLKPEQIASPEYIAGESCPYCYKTPDERQQMYRSMRALQIRSIVSPLPGSVPYDNFRPLNVPRRFDHYQLIDFLSEFHPHIGREVWQSRIEQGFILLNEKAMGLHDAVREGQRLEHLLPATVEPDVNGKIDLIYEDDYLVVVNKPAPLPMHPSGRFNRNTLTWLLSQIYDHQLRVAHRLDANTSGVVVFSRTRKVASSIQPQFEKQTVVKRYLVFVHGCPVESEFTIDLPITDQPTIAGGRRVSDTGKQCRTDCRVLATSSCGEYALLEATPRTGRTNQIRIHLWHQGHPVVGDPTYLLKNRMSATQTLSINDDPMCLHAWQIGLVHPESDATIEFTAPLPCWPQMTDAGVSFQE